LDVSAKKAYETPFSDAQLKSIYENYEALRNDPEKLLDAMIEFGVSAQDIQAAVEKFGPQKSDEAAGPDKPYQTPFNDEQLKNIYFEFTSLAGPTPEKLKARMTEFGVSAKDIQVAADKFYQKVPEAWNDFNLDQTNKMLDHIFADGFGGHVPSKDAPALREPTDAERRYIEFNRANIAAGEYGIDPFYTRVMGLKPNTGPITQEELGWAIGKDRYGGPQPWNTPDWRATLADHIADQKALEAYRRQQASEMSGNFAIGGS
jgi:hypothetical protein